MKTRLKSSHDNRRGFTLVELSIVLVIIGLIIGGVLTGQQIIQNAKITNSVNAIQSYASQLQTYQQNYGALPGDDANAARFNNAGTANGGGTGTISGSFNDPASTTPPTSNTSEALLAWADLRAAGLIKNQLPLASQPANPFNGMYGFQTGAFSGSLTGTVLCLDKVPGSAVLAIDTRLDDGAPNSGTVQASTTGAGNADQVATSYLPDTLYTMCVKM